MILIKLLKSKRYEPALLIDTPYVVRSDTASTSRGRGNADGSDLTYTHTQLKAGEQILLSSGGDTSVKGAVVQAPRIDAQVGGNLLIQSLQDTSTYSSQQKSSGGSITVGTAGVSGSVNAGKSNINSQYTSVTEQSGLRAGDGGFNVNVQGNTRLVGGAITSTQAAIDQNRNTFQTAGQSAQQALASGTLTLSDLHNQASYSASSSSVNLGTGFSPQGKLTPQGTSAGFGKDSGQASSVTQSAISGMAGNTAARTGDAETGINKIFDADRVQKEINAQTQITQLFGQQAPKAAAEFAQNQSERLKEQARQADKAGNTEEAQRLKAEAKAWDEGGAYRVALHTTIGALSGGGSGAAGAFASASSAPLLNAFQDQLTQNLKDAGANDKVAQSAGQLIASLTVAGIGAAASGGSVAGAAVAFNIDANNRQLHPTEAQLIKRNAKTYAQRRGGITLEQAEAELTQQTLRQKDSAHEARLGSDNPQAQAFLKEIGQGQVMVDPMTGQTYQLFTADEATRNNHAMFAQYVKTDPQVRQELDQAYSQALRPQDARRLDAEGRSQTGSDLALRDAAKDFTDMKNQPANVQWAVLAQLRQTRQTNQQELARLDQALKASPLSPETQAQRTQIVLQMEDLMRRDQALLVGIQAQLLDMGQTGSKLLNPGQYAEWTEGFGEARASAGLNFRGVSNANLSARSAMSREAVAERQALVQAEQAAVRANQELAIQQRAGVDGEMVGQPGQNRQLSTGLIRQVEKIEPQTTLNMARIADDTGGTLRGLEYRTKSEGSLERKLDGGANPERLNDTLRYTMTFEPAQLAQGTNNALNQLKQQGYEVVRVNNTFAPGQPYVGINTTLRSPEGQLLELQFHTPQSFNVKQNINHGLYEQQRVLTKNDLLNQTLRQQMIENSRVIQLPPNIHKLVPSVRTPQNTKGK